MIPTGRTSKKFRRPASAPLRLTQQLLAYSRKQVLLPKEVDLNQTVISLQGMLTRLIRADITLTYELAPTPALIKIDRPSSSRLF